MTERFDMSARAQKLLEENWDSISELLQKVVKGEVNATHKSVTCPHCRKRSEHPLIVQTKDIMEVVRFLRDTGPGRPSETPKKPVAPPSTAKLEELSDEELLVLVGKEDV